MESIRQSAYFLTQQARKTNWEDGSFTNKYTGEKTDTEGLKKIRKTVYSMPNQSNKYTGW